MKNNLKTAMFALALAGTAQGVQAENEVPAGQNPSQTTSPQNPSETTAPQNPSETTAPQNPSQPLVTPNPNLTSPNTSTPGQPNPGQPNPSQPNPLTPVPGTPSPNIVNPPLTGSPAVIVPNGPAPTTPADVQARRKALDKQLPDRIRKAIVQAPVASNGNPAAGAPGLSVTDLKIVQVRGQVTLTGFVHSEKEKADAGARAVGAAGGQTVVNKIIVR